MVSRGWRELFDRSLHHQCRRFWQTRIHVALEDGFVWSCYHNCCSRIRLSSQDIISPLMSCLRCQNTPSQNECERIYYLKRYTDHPNINCILRMIGYVWIWSVYKTKDSCPTLTKWYAALDSDTINCNASTKGFAPAALYQHLMCIRARVGGAKPMEIPCALTSP